MNIKNKILVLGLFAFAMFFIVSFDVVLAEESESEDLISAQDILKECNCLINEVTNLGELEEEPLERKLEIYKIQQKTVEQLVSNGYEAYHVTSESYRDIEFQLNTNLSDLGINSEGTYIIVIEGDENLPLNISAGIMKSSTNSSFTHTYNGKSYKLRYLTISGSDNSMMLKSTSVDLLKSSSTTVIERCLDTAIIACVSGASKILGTVASLSGVSVSDFKTDSQATLSLFAASAWTRSYTQVWDSDRGSWGNGAYVELVTMSSYVTGYYYDTDNSQYTRINGEETKTQKYSSHCYDFTWRRDYGVKGFLSSVIFTDRDGSTSYKYGDVVKITHSDNFY